MRKPLIVLSILLGIVFTQVAQAQELSGLFKAVSPSVVKITVYDKTRRPIKRGTGFFLASGVVVTNEHVISGGVYITFDGSQGQRFYAQHIVGIDKRNDLAVLILPAEAETNSVDLAKREPEIGEKVFVVGNPKGLGWTLSEGIVSSYRNFKDAGLRLQITADISPGSSGSPVFNMEGDVVGVVEATYEGGQRLNFELARDKPEGAVKRGGQRLVGLWRANVSEFKRQLKIFYYFGDNRDTDVTITTAEGETRSGNGKWRYADGVLYETFADGTNGKGSIKWITNDLFELTIMDNGESAYNGVKRYYRRIK
jgi:hypothetical protein